MQSRVSHALPEFVAIGKEIGNLSSGIRTINSWQRISQCFLSLCPIKVMDQETSEVLLRQQGGKEIIDARVSKGQRYPFHFAV